MRRIDVGPRPTSRDELAAWYTEALAAQAASGLTVAEFARRIGVSVPGADAVRVATAARVEPATGAACEAGGADDDPGFADGG